MSLRLWTIAVLAVGLGAVFPTLAAAPPGWLIGGNAPTDYSFAVDTTTAASGKRSASITAKPGAKANGFGALWQTVAADNYRGARWRLSGYLRTQDANRAQMWMRVDGADGNVLSFDNMDSRPVTGTTGWRRYDIVLDVPSNSVDITFGFLLISSGKLWADDFELDRVDSTVPVTSAGPTLPPFPSNLDFEDTNSSETSVWTPRRLHFILGIGLQSSCDWLANEMKFVLLELGARARDLEVNTERCYNNTAVPAVDATFSVLEPVGNTRGSKAGEAVEAGWTAIELKSRPRPLAGHDECLLLKNVPKEILPLFSTRDVKLLSGPDCGFRAETLMPPQSPKTSP